MEMTESVDESGDILETSCCCIHITCPTCRGPDQVLEDSGVGEGQEDRQEPTRDVDSGGYRDNWADVLLPWSVSRLHDWRTAGGIPRKGPDSARIPTQVDYRPIGPQSLSTLRTNHRQPDTVNRHMLWMRKQRAMMYKSLVIPPPRDIIHLSTDHTVSSPDCTPCTVVRRGRWRYTTTGTYNIAYTATPLPNVHVPTLVNLITCIYDEMTVVVCTFTIHTKTRFSQRSETLNPTELPVIVY